MVNKKPISQKKARSNAPSTPKRARGQPRKVYPTGLISETTCAEIDAILRKEKRDYIRKRLTAVRTIYAGGTDADAADRARASLASVWRWMRLSQTKGISALLRAAEGKKPKVRFAEARAAKLRKAITVALERVRNPASRTRLLAASAVLDGRSTTSAARHGGITATTVGAWMRKLHRHGVKALLPVDGDPLLNPDAQRLRSLASRERDHRVALRMAAMALLAEGKSCQQAADRVGVSFVTVHDWRKRFRADGIDGLRDR